MTTSLAVIKRTGPVGDGDIPAVVYGPKQEAISLAINKKVFEKTLSEAGESTIIVLEGAGEPIEVLVHDVDFNPVKGGVRHVDFYAIERGKELTVDVPLEFQGEPPALKMEGVLTEALHEVEVTCRPSNLPHSIVVDVSVLETFEDSIRVKDLVLPEGVKIENDPEETVAIVVPVQEEAEEPAEAVDMDAIEVEGKGKEEAAEEGDGKTE